MWSGVEEEKRESAQLLGTLAFFSAVIDRMDEATKVLILAVAPHVDLGIDVFGLVGSLERFADTDPDGVVDVLRTAVTARPPAFDHEGKLRKVLIALVAKGKSTEVFSLVDEGSGTCQGWPRSTAELADGKD